MDLFLSLMQQLAYFHEYHHLNFLEIFVEYLVMVLMKIHKVLHKRKKKARH